MESLSDVSLFLIVLLTLLFLISLWEQQKRSRLLPPGPTPIPLLGTPSYITMDSACKYPQLQKKYGDLFTIWLLGDPVVVLCGYDVVRDALINHAEEFSGRPVQPLADKHSQGYNFESSNTHWRHFRRFTLTTLRNIGLGKKPLEERCLMEAKQLVEAVSEMEGRPFNPIHLLGCAVFNFISSILFGQQWGYSDKNLQECIRHTREHVDNVLNKPSQVCAMFPLFLKVPFLWKVLCRGTLRLHSFVTEQIEFHKETLDANAPRDFVDFFLLKIKEEEGLPDSIYCDTSLLMNLTGLMVAATDSTSCTLKYCVAMLAQYPDIQVKVQRELDHVTGCQRPPGLSDRPNLPYTNAVIHELQRHLDIAPIAFYHALTRDTRFRGYTLPKGTRIIPYLSSVLFDPTQWETPDEFNPGHFLDEKGQFRTKPAFMAFSAGRRECLGVSLARMEIFILLSSLLQKFTFSRVSGKKLELKCPKKVKMDFIISSEIRAVPRPSVTDRPVNQ
ncbi:cytochrome P450 2C20-like [Xenopus tropicalis]|uniref:Cytochrome P450 2B4-like n=1 Tax=Xenopus tropicalis TaxID=8364 RepID=A0A803JCS7_XENTR|nr:cytochrome P450 2C20-like [Xenopus tropicalis]